MGGKTHDHDEWLGLSYKATNNQPALALAPTSNSMQGCLNIVLDSV